MTIKAYSYARYSTAVQGQGDSLRRQLKGCVDWVAEFEKNTGISLELDTRLQDLGVSSYTGVNRVRGALGSFLARVERGEIERGSYLCVDSMDRLSRENETRVLNMLTNLTLAGIKVVNVSEDHVLDENAEMVDYMRVLIHASRSHMESKEKSRKIGESRANDKRRAREEGRVWHRTCPAWLEAHQTGKKERKIITFTPISERIATIQHIFDMREAGMGSHVIALRLNDRIDLYPTFPGGGRTTRHKGWQGNGVSRILQSRTVLGEYQPKRKVRSLKGYYRDVNDGDPIPGYYGEPIIDPAQFHRVQALIAKSLKVKGRKNNHTEFRNLFQGACVCSDCGGTVGGIKNRKGGNLYLRCIQAQARTPGVMATGKRGPDGEPIFSACTNRQSYPYIKLEASILEHVTHFEISKPVADDRRDALTLAMAERDEISRRLQRIIDELEDPRNDGDEDLRDRRRQRRDELAAKNAEITRLKMEITQNDAATPIAHHVATIRELRAKLDSLKDAELYDLRVRLSSALKSVIDWLSFDDDGLVHAFVLGGELNYHFVNGEFIGTTQPLPGFTNRRSVTEGDPDRERLFEKVSKEPRQPPAQGAWADALRKLPTTLESEPGDDLKPGEHFTFLNE